MSRAYGPHPLLLKHIACIPFFKDPEEEIFKAWAKTIPSDHRIDVCLEFQTSKKGPKDIPWTFFTGDKLAVCVIYLTRALWVAHNLETNIDTYLLLNEPNFLGYKVDSHKFFKYGMPDTRPRVFAELTEEAWEKERDKMTDAQRHASYKNKTPKLILPSNQ